MSRYDLKINLLVYDCFKKTIPFLEIFNLLFGSIFKIKANLIQNDNTFRKP